jgi:hypothetical protein
VSLVRFYSRLFGGARWPQIGRREALRPQGSEGASNDGFRGSGSCLRSVCWTSRYNDPWLMADTSLRPEERIAGDILARQLGGIMSPRDVPGAPEGTHEFDVELPSGRRIAVEVTAATDGAMEALHGAAFGQRWDAPTLAHDWWLVLPMVGGFNVGKMASKVIPTLRSLTPPKALSTSLCTRSLPASTQTVASAIQRVLRLGVRTAARLGSPESGETAQLRVRGDRPTTSQGRPPNYCSRSGAPLVPTSTCSTIRLRIAPGGSLPSSWRRMETSGICLSGCVTTTPSLQWQHCHHRIQRHLYRLASM